MATLKDQLQADKLPPAAISAITNYIASAQKAEEKKEANKRPVSSNDASELYRLIMKYWALGLPVDGVNVVVTGHNMGMVTYHGYKNKVLQVYPDSAFDVQLVREGDTFDVAKESGSVVYTHNFGDPFGEAPIRGAYVVIKNSRGEYLELLGRKDYEQMKKASKQSYLWGDWESEFFLKSVLKRACKRHFNDVTAEIDKVDNEDYGMVTDPRPPEEDEDAIQAAIDSLNTVDTVEDLRTVYMGLGKIRNNAKVVAAKDAIKARLEKETAAPQGEVGKVEGVTVVPDEESTDENTQS